MLLPSNPNRSDSAEIWRLKLAAAAAMQQCMDAQISKAEASKIVGNIFDGHLVHKKPVTGETVDNWRDRFSGDACFQDLLLEARIKEPTPEKRMARLLMLVASYAEGSE